MATPTVTAPAGELIAVIGPDTEQRAGMLLALARTPWATGPAVTIGADPDVPATWAELRRAADDGATVIAACERAEDAGPYAHRMVLLPHPDGHP